MKTTDPVFSSRLSARHRYGRLFAFCCAASTWFGLGMLSILLASIVWKAFGWLDWEFLTSFDSRHPDEAGVLAGLWGSVWLVIFTALFSLPVGVGAAVYLEEYSEDSRLRRIIQVNLANLAGVPSIVYGILGLTVFVRMFGAFQGNPKTLLIPLGFASMRVPLPLGPSVLAASLTLSLLVLPIVVVAAQEALRAIPPSIRHASYALGATPWQTIRHQVLPAALPGIFTGSILAISRAIGETAPLVIIGALTYVAFTPGDIARPTDMVSNPQGVLEAPFDKFTALPLQIYSWAAQSKPAYQNVAAAGILVLLAVMLVFNGIAVFLRQRAQKRTRW